MPSDEMFKNKNFQMQFNYTNSCIYIIAEIKSYLNLKQNKIYLSFCYCI